MRAVEEAIARQVLHGGDLATNLLELLAVSEEALVKTLAESFGMEPAPHGALPAPNASLLRMIPAEVAFRHGIFPLAFEGGALHVATSEPLPAAVEEDLSFSLNVALRPLIAPLVRIRQAIAGCYGIPLDRRMTRLLAKLEGRPDPSPTLAPPAATSLNAPHPSPMPTTVSVPPPNFGTGLPPAIPEEEGSPGVPSSSVASELPPIPPVPAVPLLRPFDAAGPGTRRVSTWGAPSPDADVEPAFDAQAPAAVAPLEGEGVDVSGEREREPPSSVPREEEGGDETLSEALATQGAARERIAKRGLASWLRRAVLEEKGRAAPDAPERAGARPRRKGPFTAAMAEQDLEDAISTDEVLDIFFAFSRQFFVFSMLFVVHGDMAEGRNAWGPSAGLLDPTTVGVPLSLPSTLSLARKRRAPVVAAFTSEGIDAEFVRDLERASPPGGPQLAAAVIPLVVRSRVVALLYGDDADMPVELSSIGDVIAMTALTAAALERLILKRKLSAFRAPEGPPPNDAPPPGARAPEGPSPNDAPPPAEPAPESGGAAQPAEEPRPSEAGRRAPSSIKRPPSLTPEIEVGWTIPPPEVALDPNVGPLAAARETLPAASMPGEVLFDEGDTYAGMGPDLELPRVIFGKREVAEAWEPPGIVGEAAWPPSQEGRAYRRLGTAPPPPPSSPAPVVLPPLPPPTPLPLPPAPPPSPSETEALVDEFWSADSQPHGAASLEEAPKSAKPVPPGLLRRPLTGAPIPREEPGVSPPPIEDTAGPPASPSVPLARLQLVAKLAEDRREPPQRRVTPSGGVPSRGEIGSRRPPEPSIAPPGANAELHAKIARVIAKGPDAERAFAELVESGEQAMPLLMADFPGPLTVDRHRAREVVSPASRCGPVLELIVAMGRIALPPLSVRSTSGDVEVRFWATHALGELPFSEAASAVVPRLFDPDMGVRKAARRSARALVAAGPGGAPIVQGLGHITRNIDEPTRRRVLAIEAMGDIRSGALVPPLISALSDPTEDIIDAGRRALVMITRQDFGTDADAWAEWWRRSSGRHRVEWLIDALTHDSLTLRRAAADELMELTSEYFGYHEELSPEERARVQGHYRDFWEREGRERFRAEK